MSVLLHTVLGGQLDRLRHEPTAKRVRAEVDGTVIADSERTVLVWEPRRLVPTYAFPIEDVRGELRPSAHPESSPEGRESATPELSARPVWDPRVPFGVRLTEGQALEIGVPGADRAVAAFRPDDPDLAGYVIVDFAGADRWFEEDEPVTGHPRDPFHRVDVRDSSRHVQVLRDGRLLADSRRPRLVFETQLPPRFYLPPEDVVATLRPSGTRTTCPYKGDASYWSVDLGPRTVPDLVWSYADPLPDAAQLRGYLAFFDERVDVVVDGVTRQRPVTPWSDAAPRYSR